MKFITVEEIAEVLKIHRNTVVGLIERGDLKALKIGKVWRIKEEDFNEYLKSAEHKPKEE